MYIPMIAISGGPCAGKSSFLEEAGRWLAEHGITAVVVPEAATKLINAGVTPWDVGIEAFQRRILRATQRRIRRYKRVIERSGRTNVVLFVDRGLLDCEAYCGEPMFRSLLSELGLNRVLAMEDYLMVIHLVTAADGAEEFYTLGNNAARIETPEQARALDHKSRHAWRGHRHLSVIDNRTDFPRKMQRAVSAMKRVLHMPIPLENERMFLIRNFTMDMIPAGAAKIDIVQNYLNPHPIHKGARRVRSETLEGVTTYHYTHKSPTGTVGSVTEPKYPPLTKGEYEELLKDADPACLTILKTRYRFPFADRTFEVDVYQSQPWRQRRVVKLEVEMEDLSETIVMPDGWILDEVTGRLEWSNYGMARIRD